MENSSRTSLPSTCAEERKKREKREEKMRLPALLCLLWAAAGPAAAADRSCTDLRQFYTSKGFTLGGVPQAEISGELATIQTPFIVRTELK